jgi:hypothetical protein
MHICFHLKLVLRCGLGLEEEAAAAGSASGGRRTLAAAVAWAHAYAAERRAARILRNIRQLRAPAGTKAGGN